MGFSFDHPGAVMSALAAFGAAAALGGCSSGGDNGPGREESIRGWSKAVNERRYGDAAAFFAKGAIVEQAREFRLEDRKDAIAFNRDLPCKATVTDVEDEGETVLAAFRLRGGPFGGCDGGTARVRFRFRAGKFSEWRQLPEPEPGDVI